MPFNNNLTRIWSIRQARAQDITSRGQVYIERASSGRIHVTCPPRSEFATKAAELSGRWRYKSGVWTFPIASKRLVIELCKRVYGAEAVTYPDDLLT